MRPRSYEAQNGSIARALEVLGDRWTLLLVRDVFLGLRRLDDFQRGLGVARNVLADRLERLVDEGILAKRRYGSGRSASSTGSRRRVGTCGR